MGLRLVSKVSIKYTRDELYELCITLKTSSAGPTRREGRFFLPHCNTNLPNYLKEYSVWK